MPSTVKALSCNRCHRFHRAPPPHDPGYLAFTHVPKMGGTSVQQLLVAEALEAGKVVLNVNHVTLHVPGQKPTIFPKLSLNELRVLSKSADVLIGHGAAAWEEGQGAHQLGWRGGNFSRVTMMRDPLDTLQSLFRYNNGQPEAGTRSIYARNLTLQQGYDEFLQAKCAPLADNTCAPIDRGATGVVALHRPATSPGGATGLVSTMMHIASEYAVVGVLERLEETLEVLKCRAPWVNATGIPHKNPTPRYPVQLKDNEQLMRQISAKDIQLYVLANLVLSLDVACCRKLLSDAEAAELNPEARARHFLAWWADRPAAAGAVPKYLPEVHRTKQGWVSMTRCNDRLAFVHIFKAAGSAVHGVIKRCGRCNCTRAGAPMGLCVEAPWVSGSNGVASAGLRRTNPSDGYNPGHTHTQARGRAGPAASMLFSVARHPVTRFEAAVAEIFARTFSPRFEGVYDQEWAQRDTPEEQLVGKMLASILRHGRLWDAHLTPQHYFLLERGANGRDAVKNETKRAALPVNFIGDTATLEMDAQWIFRAAGIEANMSALLHHEGGPGTREPSVHLDRRRIRAGPDEVRVICQLYYEDFVALAYALPEPCLQLQL